MRVFGCVLRSCFCLIGFICHDVADITFFIITAVADLLVGAAGVFVWRWMWRGTGGKGRRQAACLCLTARREVAETMCLTFDIHTPNGSGIYIHTHEPTRRLSQAPDRRDRGGVGGQKEGGGRQRERRLSVGPLQPSCTLSSPLSLGPSFLIPWQWPCAPPLLSRSHTHTQGQAVHVSPTRQIHHLPSGPSSSPLLLLALIGWVRRDWDGRGSTLHPCNCC